MTDNIKEIAERHTEDLKLKLLLLTPVDSQHEIIYDELIKAITEYESSEIARLRGIIEALEKQMQEIEHAEYEPYMGWCDVDGCSGESSSNGGNWSETGYWCLCPKHSKLARDGGEQPKMKQSAIDRENKRDKTTGILSISEAEEQ